ncbi:MAG: hypothetical protein V4517_26150 [Pseudomonadota bacterium]
MIEIISHVLFARAVLVTSLSRLPWKRFAVIGRRSWRTLRTAGAGARS